MDRVKILEPRWYERGVREAIHIRMKRPSEQRRGSLQNPLNLEQCVEVASPGFSTEDEQPIRIPASKLLTPSVALTE